MPYYKARRDNLLVVTRTCDSPCSTCFCHWTGGGPAYSDRLRRAAHGRERRLRACRPCPRRARPSSPGRKLADGADKHGRSQGCPRKGRRQPAARPGSVRRRPAASKWQPVSRTWSSGAGTDREVSVLRGVHLHVPDLPVLQHHRRGQHPRRPPSAQLGQLHVPAVHARGQRAQPPHGQGPAYAQPRFAQVTGTLPTTATGVSPATGCGRCVEQLPRCRWTSVKLSSTPSRMTRKPNKESEHGRDAQSPSA